MKTLIEKRELRAIGIWLGVVVLATTLVAVKNLAFAEVLWPSGGSTEMSSVSVLGQVWLNGLEAGFLSGFVVLGCLIWRGRPDSLNGMEKARKWGTGLLAMVAFGFWVMFVTPALNLTWMVGQFQVANGLSPAEVGEIEGVFGGHHSCLSLPAKLQELDSLKLKAEKMAAQDHHGKEEGAKNEKGFTTKHPGLLDSDSARMAAVARLEAMRRSSKDPLGPIYVSSYDRQMVRLTAEIWKVWAIVGWALVLWIWGAALSGYEMGRRIVWLAIISIAGGFLAEVLLAMGLNWASKEGWSAFSAFVPPLLAGFFLGVSRWRGAKAKSPLT